jgi:uncharacterized protein
MPYEPPLELAGLSLAEIAEAVAARKPPPIPSWSPVVTGESHMRIAADGSWWHEGSRITRPAMVRAFASLLMRDEVGQHWLVTPHQKLAIEVEDAAFVAVDCVERDGAMVFRLNTDEIVIAGPQHALSVRGNADAPAAYLAVRHGCEARLDRSTWFQLAEIALAQDDGSSVTSGGATFPLLPA